MNYLGSHDFNPKSSLDIHQIKGLIKEPSMLDSMGVTVTASTESSDHQAILVIDGNPETRKRMEAAGCEVTAYKGREISIKGGGGPTCLTRPLLRG